MVGRVMKGMGRGRVDSGGLMYKTRGKTEGVAHAMCLNIQLPPVIKLVSFL